MSHETLSSVMEDILNEVGGLGRFQWIFISIILISRLSMTWSMLVMTFAGAKMDWWCIDESMINLTDSQLLSTNLTRDTYQNCTCDGGTTPARYLYQRDMWTTRGEWDLQCDNNWVVATITTIQMGGVLVGGSTGGYIGDRFGRKPTYYLAILTLLVFNLIGAFSVSWEMFAAIRFGIGFGCGIFITTWFVHCTEYVPNKWRTLLVAIPSWAIWACVYGGVAWIVPDWKKVHYVTAAFCVPFLLTWRIVPESFRWLVAKRKFDEAEKVLQNMAKWNKKPIPDFNRIRKVVGIEADDKEKKGNPTIITLFRSKDLTKKTLLLAFMWEPAEHMVCIAEIDFRETETDKKWSSSACLRLPSKFDKENLPIVQAVNGIVETPNDALNVFANFMVAEMEVLTDIQWLQLRREMISPWTATGSMTDRVSNHPSHHSNFWDTGVLAEPVVPDSTNAVHVVLSPGLRYPSDARRNVEFHLNASWMDGPANFSGGITCQCVADGHAQKQAFHNLKGFTREGMSA
ncbi:hypothetical protein ScPMuIL_019012 [Solemya velum]